MNRSRHLLIGLFVSGGAAALILLGLYIYGFAISSPDYDDEFFSRDMCAKYADLERTWERLIDAIRFGDADLFQEVLGMRISPEERRAIRPIFVEESLRISEIREGKGDAYIVADNNWGHFFEKVRGRWVFSRGDWGAVLREVFRSL